MQPQSRRSFADTDLEERFLVRQQDRPAEHVAGTNRLHTNLEPWGRQFHGNTACENQVAGPPNSLWASTTWFSANETSVANSAMCPSCVSLKPCVNGCCVSTSVSGKSPKVSVIRLF